MSCVPEASVVLGFVCGWGVTSATMRDASGVALKSVPSAPAVIGLYIARRRGRVNCGALSAGTGRNQRCSEHCTLSPPLRTPNADRTTEHLQLHTLGRRNRKKDGYRSSDISHHAIRGFSGGVGEGGQGGAVLLWPKAKRKTHSHFSILVINLTT